MKPGERPPQPPSTPSTDGLLFRASPGERAAIEALVKTGSVKDAQADLGITASALKNRLAGLRARNAGLTNVQLAYRLGRQDDE